EEQPASFSLLMNSTRMIIYTHLCQNPCDHTRSIARAIKISLTTVNWHLGQLLEYEYLEAKMVNRKKLYWPTAMLKPEDAEMISCLRHDIPPKILGIISKNSKVRQKLIVENMHMKQQNIDFWLKKMENSQIIQREGKGMGMTFHISEYFTSKIDDYDKAARNYSKQILEILHYDGLMPKNARFKGSRLGVDIKLPSGKRRIHLECSPLGGLRGKAA
ncbi:MAG: winged helix-turn-helix transcriptional regulator, partial [Gammaproteobacteria bacterium]|nr:winged helix-turn-helix transcriptional regulator [Gammaproteobacteria bacterium]